MSLTQFNPPEVIVETKTEVPDSNSEVLGRIGAVGAFGTCLVYDEKMMNHRCNGFHPEQPERIKRIYEEIASRGLAGRCTEIGSRKATTEEITTVHDKGW